MAEEPAKVIEEGHEVLRRRKIYRMRKSEFEDARKDNSSLELVETPFIDLSDAGQLFEQCFDGKNVFYAVWTRDNPVEYTDPHRSIIYDEETGRWYAPIDDELLQAGDVLLPSGIEECAEFSALFQEVKDFLDKYHDQPNEAERVLDTLYIFLTWIADLLPAVPYRRILGPPKRGKTRYLRSMWSLCRVSTWIAGASTVASLRRYLGRWKGSLVVDEANFKNTELEAPITKVLCLGFEKGATIALFDKDKGENMLLNVYGPKILGSREELKDEAAETRILSFDARAASRRKPIYLSKPFKEASQHLRNKLLLWRFRNYYNLKAKADELEDLALHNIFPEGTDDRVKQIITPFYLIGDDSVKSTLNGFVKTVHQAVLDRDELPAFINSIKEALTEPLKDENGTPIGDALLTLQAGENVNLVYGSRYSKIYRTIPIKLLDITERLLGPIDAKDVRERRRMGYRIAHVLRHELGWRVRPGGARYRVVEVPISVGGLDLYTSFTGEEKDGVSHVDPEAVAVP